MRETLDPLPPGGRVLDLGCGPGSFALARTDLVLIRLDRSIPSSRKSGLYVEADAAHLPFRRDSFDAVISNHSLEHFEDMAGALSELGRAAKPGAAVYIAVPDAGAVTDRIYRWLGRGGGHVNAFRHPREVIDSVERLTGLRHTGTRILYSSLSFLNNHNFTAPPPKKIGLFAFGNEYFLAVLVSILRACGLSRYGWAFYFGSATAPEDEPWVNVCVRCGSGHAPGYLRKAAAIRGRLLRTYRCPICCGWNILA